MTALAAAAVDAFLRRPDPDLVAVLIYGPDSGIVRERAGAIVRALVGSLDDPFTVARLDDGRIGDDPAILADEAASLSLLGGRRVVWVRDAGTAFFNAVQPLLQRGQPGNLIVAEAGALQKKSAMRTAFEKSPQAAIIACYADGARETQALIDRELRAADLAIEDDAREALAEILEGDRDLARQELDKLITYCIGTKSVSMADIDAVCRDSILTSLDGLLDTILEGDMAASDDGIHKMIDSGTTADRILGALAQHVAKLQALRASMSDGRSASDVVKTARPPVFFKRQASIARQLAIWDLPSLRAAGTAIGVAIRDSRGRSSIGEAIAVRSMLSLARKARAGRVTAN